MIRYFFVLFCFFGFLSCTKSQDAEKLLHEPAIQENKDGIRISWDYSSKVKIAPSKGHTEGYCGYARLIQLHDQRLACVYETSSGNTELVFSTDSGKSWGTPQIVFGIQNNISMSVPEIIELKDQAILVACNPRPREPYTPDRKFGIRVRKSTNGGQSWGEDQLVYEAQSTFNNGCWEPSFLQLPDGEVQLFFSNEGIYTSSNEQNISIFRSYNAGNTWTKEPEIIGFRKDKRDGMPVPLIIPETGEILVAVEDNKAGEFKPTIYHEKLTNNWSNGFVSALDSRRSYHPLEDQLPNETYAGAPYLARLGTGEVLLSYQSTWNRSNIWDKSEMVVEIGTTSGTSFKNRTVPFRIPLTSHGLWNSIAVIDGNTPVALTSTNAYAYNSTEVWMVKGHVVPEFSIPQGSVIVDGNADEECWKPNWPYFLGNLSKTSILASIAADANTIFLVFRINQADAILTNQSEVLIQLDTERKGYDAPHQGIYSFHLKLDRTILVEAGNFGEWQKISDNKGLQYKIKNNGATLLAELAIPSVFLNCELNSGRALGFNISARFVLKSDELILESFSPNNELQPSSWCPVWLK